MDNALIKFNDDEALVRWVALLLIEGRKESDIRRELHESSLIESSIDPDGWRKLMSSAKSEASSMRSLVISRAELGNTDWLRLDSYTRRKRTLDRIEDLLEYAIDQVDSVSKANSASFMAAGLIKAQDSMDKFSGASQAVPAVQINIGYDPMDQFRDVIQAEAIEVLDIEPNEERPGTVDEEE